jgi:hypothetical protein
MLSWSMVSVQWLICWHTATVITNAQFISVHHSTFFSYDQLAVSIHSLWWAMAKSWTTCVSCWGLHKKEILCKVFINFVGSVQVQLYPEKWHETGSIANWKINQPKHVLIPETLEDIQTRPMSLNSQFLEVWNGSALYVFKINTIRKLSKTEHHIFT